MQIRTRCWGSSSVVYELNLRQFTEEGSFASAERRLPFLRALGVDILWLMPIFPIGAVDRKGTLGSYYSVQSYCAVNEEFGTMADFDSFLLSAHALGFVVVLDWVANHTSRDALWLTSKPSDWYERDEAGVAVVPCDWSDTAKLNYDNRDVWSAQVEAMRYWVQRGVDGFRCDMAMLVPLSFWQYVRRELTRQCGDVLLIAEAEGPEYFDAAFDICYGWELHHLMVSVARGERRADSLREYVGRMSGADVSGECRLLFTSNHDENSWQGSDVSRFGEALPAMQIFTFVVTRGVPLIYMGQEVGYDHSFSFFDRDPIPEDLYVVTGATRFLRTLVAFRRRYDALWSCDGVVVPTNADDSLFVFVIDSDGGDRVVAMLNLSAYSIEADYDMGRYAGRYSVVVSSFDDDSGWYHISGNVQERLPPWSYRLLCR